MRIRDPILETVDAAALRPTQITVGLREVAAKRKAWRERGENGAAFLGKHLVPVILGPGERHYVTDHHHLVRALMEEGQTNVAISTIADLRHLPKDSFWFVLDNRGWMHPFDEEGKRRDRHDIPKSIADLVDDPFRSLAGELRLQGGFAKDTTPFSEFLWADFLRHRIKRHHVVEDFDTALADALVLARLHALQCGDRRAAHFRRAGAVDGRELSPGLVWSGAQDLTPTAAGALRRPHPFQTPSGSVS